MAEFPLDLYPPADFTREDILRQIFGEVGDLCHGKLRSDIAMSKLTEHRPYIIDSIIHAL